MITQVLPIHHVSMELIPLSQAPATCLRSWFWCFTSLLAVLQDWNLSQSKLYWSTDVFKLLQTCLIHSEPTHNSIYIYTYANYTCILYTHLDFMLGCSRNPATVTTRIFPRIGGSHFAPSAKVGQWPVATAPHHNVASLAPPMLEMRMPAR